MIDEGSHSENFATFLRKSKICKFRSKEKWWSTIAILKTAPELTKITLNGLNRCRLSELSRSFLERHYFTIFLIVCLLIPSAKVYLASLKYIPFFQYILGYNYSNKKLKTAIQIADLTSEVSQNYLEISYNPWRYNTV